ncbi:hypothetical protein VTJ04DRAFT_7506 [Mycothermus thermophilus]|uniref:uncharacterized protein n=1 Tax=Humicola insolens TaxID=85995 RepID=UPI003742EC07
MASPIVNATVQATILSIISNLLAQAITAHQSNTPLKIDWITVFQYSFFALISTPPNFRWQGYLESTWPAFPSSSSSSSKQNGSSEKDKSTSTPKLSWPNTLKKLLLDQTLGCALNNLAFGLYIHSFRQAAAHHYSSSSSSSSSAPASVLADFLRPSAVSWDQTWAQACADLLPLMTASWKFWPWVALGNFVFLTSIEARTLAGALAGLAWGVYLSLATAAA